MEVSTLRLPEEFRRSLKKYADKRPVMRLLRKGNLSTVCEEARCPNIGECFGNKTATFMIMGDRCTRRCKFCAVTTQKPRALDPKEPHAVAHAAKELGLDFVVITCVDRDDISDCGTGHFVKVVETVHSELPHAKIEVLTSDFQGKLDLVESLCASPIDVFGHNIETVERLYKSLRPQSEFATSLGVLRHAAQVFQGVVKSGMMVGVGETDDEVCHTLEQLYGVGVKVVTIGQYLRPSLKHWPVARYVNTNSYERFVSFGKALGLKKVVAGPFVRSSYHAKETHENLLV